MSSACSRPASRAPYTAYTACSAATLSVRSPATDKNLHEALDPVHVYSVRDGLDITGLVHHVAAPTAAGA